MAAAVAVEDGPDSGAVMATNIDVAVVVVPPVEPPPAPPVAAEPDDATGEAAQPSARPPSGQAAQPPGQVVMWLGATREDGTLLPLALADGSEIVLGVPIADNGMGKLVRRVIILSAVGATFYICNFTVNLMRGSYNPQNKQDVTSLWAAMSSLLIELSIPACGYSGAVYSNRQMTCCFCSCNLFIAIISVMSFIRLNIYISEIERCDREPNPRQRRTCELWTSDGPDKYFMLGSTILIIVIGSLAFWFGNMLYNRLAQDYVLSMPATTPLVGEVIALSPEAVAMSGVTVGASLPRVIPVAEPHLGDGGVAGPSGGGSAEEPVPATIVQVDEIPPEALPPEAPEAQEVLGPPGDDHRAHAADRPQASDPSPGVLSP